MRFLAALRWFSGYGFIWVLTPLFFLAYVALMLTNPLGGPYAPCMLWAICSIYPSTIVYSLLSIHVAVLAGTVYGYGIEKKLDRYPIMWLPSRTLVFLAKEAVIIVFSWAPLALAVLAVVAGYHQSVLAEHLTIVTIEAVLKGTLIFTVVWAGISSAVSAIIGRASVSMAALTTYLIMFEDLGGTSPFTGLGLKELFNKAVMGGFYFGTLKALAPFAPQIWASLSLYAVALVITYLRGV